MRSRANSATFSIQEELHFDLDPDFDVSATHLVKLVRCAWWCGEVNGSLRRAERVLLGPRTTPQFAMMDKDGNGTLTYDELHESLLSMPGLQSIPRSVLVIDG